MSTRSLRVPAAALAAAALLVPARPAGATSSPPPAPCTIGAEPAAYVRLAVLDREGTPTGSVVDSRCPGRTLVRSADVVNGYPDIALSGSVAPGSEVRVNGDGTDHGWSNLAVAGGVSFAAQAGAQTLAVTYVAVSGGQRNQILVFVTSL